MRSLAFAPDGLHAMSGLVPRGRHQHCRRACRDRPQYLRGLRPMRGRLPYRRGILVAAGGCAHTPPLSAMLMAFREAGGEHAVVLLHDEAHGTPLIDALARFGDGLPANVLPLLSTRSLRSGWKPSSPLSLTAPRRCAFCCAQSPVTTSPACRGQSRWRIRSLSNSALVRAVSRQ